jgi:hypothetical protein
VDSTGTVSTLNDHDHPLDLIVRAYVARDFVGAILTCALLTGCQSAYS